MLTLIEKILFPLALAASLVVAYQGGRRIVHNISSGHGKPDWKLAQKRLINIVFLKYLGLQPTWRLRFIPSLFHALVAWGFTYYLLVNVLDVVHAYVPSFQILGLIGNMYRLGSDLLSISVVVGMIFLVIRRWVQKPADLTTRETTLLHPKARFGIKRDSAIVSCFILLHICSRFLGESFSLASNGLDAWQPFASAVARLWFGFDSFTLTIATHIFFWLALGSILLFIPYFPYSKHIHLIFAPLNYLLKPERLSIGELEKLNFDDESVEQFGATKVGDLGWEQIMDAYACIMCYRCQEVCPAYSTGKVLSPAALEINKRYSLNGITLNDKEIPETSLVECVITPEAVWACTACGACIDICPVGNEPMRDIIDIRRSLVLTENKFPKQLQVAFRGMEHSGNPWGIPRTERMKWAEGLNVPTVKDNPEPEILWWVGCAPTTDALAQRTARAFVRILEAANVEYAVLGESEQCTGDSARRAGNEYLFNELATFNVGTLNKLKPKRIVTTCPHCMHVLKNEYPAFGGNYQVIHHTQLISELLTAGKLKLSITNKQMRATFHDPCYLGRQNEIVTDPRVVLQYLQAQMIEPPRHGKKSFCCGAGGAQMWKEEENGTEYVSANRLREIIAAGSETLVVGCPFCQIMLNDASKEGNCPIKIVDLAEVVASLVDKEPAMIRS